MCGDCRDTGWVQEQLPGGFTASKRCHCRERGQDTSKYAQLRLPPRFAHANFDNFSAGTYAEEPETYRVLTHAMSMGRVFADEFPVESSKGLLFHGGTLERRTHLAVATLKRLADKGLHCLFFDYQNLLDSLQGRSGDADQEREEIARLANSVDVLLIESLGDRRPTDWGMDTIYAIIKHRYHNKMGLLATTGLPLASMVGEIKPGTQAMHAGARSPDTLEQRIGRQCAEMLEAICTTVPVTVPAPEPSVPVPYRSHS